MTSPVLALRRAILDAASADAELRALMGGTLRLYDEPPRAAEPVYALFGDVKARATGRPISTAATSRTSSLVVWSEKGGARTALVVAERFFAILDDAPLASRATASSTCASPLASPATRIQLARVTLACAR